MSSTYDIIVSRIQEAFKPSELEVTVISESEAKYNVRILSAAFAGVPLIQRHRMVNALFEEELRSGSIHALTISAKPPVWNGEWGAFIGLQVSRQLLSPVFFCCKLQLSGQLTVWNTRLRLIDMDTSTTCSK